MADAHCPWMKQAVDCAELTVDDKVEERAERMVPGECATWMERAPNM